MPARCDRKGLLRPAQQPPGAPCDQSYFIKHFKRLTGTTPLRYRRARGAPRA